VTALATEPQTSNSGDIGTREAILRCTLDLIGREGIAAVTNRRVAAAAEVSLGSLTYHFPSQVDLLRETLLLYVGEEVARLEAIAAELRGASVTVEQVAAEVERVVVASAGRPEQVAEIELHLRASRDPGLQEASRRTFAAYEAFAAAALTALGLPDPERHAPAVVALITGMTLRAIGSGGEWRADLAGALLTLVHGIANE
jgi:DNA-binding transcriptional regulator YbjK